MASEANRTVIGRSSHVRGELSGECDVQIDGVLEGSVHVASSRITVGPEATVRATLRAQDIVVYGHVEGELHATGRVDLRSTAVVVGNVFATRIAIQDEATLRIQVEAGQVPENATKPAANQPGSETRQPAAADEGRGAPSAGSQLPSAQPAAAASHATA